MFAMSESPKFRQITKKYKSRIEKRKDRLALRSTASYLFCRNTEKRYPYLCDKSSSSAAAQQQPSRSTAEVAAAAVVAVAASKAAQAAQHGKPFFAELSQQHRSPQNIVISTTSGETLNTI